MQRGQWQRIKADMRERHYSTIPFGLDTDAILHAREAFLQFLTLPRNVKDPLCYSLKNDGGGLVGYKFSTPTKGETDAKEHFHYHASLEDLASLEACPDLGVVVGKYVQDDGVHKKGDDLYQRLTPFEAQRRVVDALRHGGVQARTFLDAAAVVHKAATRTITDLAAEIEHDLPGFSAAMFPGGDPYFFLRFIAYHPAATLGKPHYDRGCITLAIDESGPGLRIGRDKDSIALVKERLPGEALIFVSLGLKERMAALGLEPAWHDIVRVDGAPYVAPDIARTSMVFFADLKEKFDRPYAETHPDK